MSDPTSLPSFPPPENVHPLRGRVIDALQDLGVSPDIDPDGDVAFSVDQAQLFARCTDAEVPILRVFGQWQLADDVRDDEALLARTCNEVNLSLNFAKTGIANQTLVCASDHAVTEGADLRTLVGVAVQVVLAGVEIWHRLVQGLDPQSGEPTSEGDPS